MRKSFTARITAMILTLALTLGPCVVTMAADSADATRNLLKSQGNIVYADGENSVEIYSDDLYTIADQLDSYKTSIANQLGKIHTYFTANTDKGTGTTTNSKVNVTHKTPESKDTVDPLAMDFDTLLEGLAASQSIPTDVTEYGYSSGQKLYQTDGGTLTTDSYGNTQINITPAAASNLSAGTAAWVNGNLILGTGADNTDYYEIGCSQSSIGYEMDSVVSATTVVDLSAYEGKTITLALICGVSKNSITSAIGADYEEVFYEYFNTSKGTERMITVHIYNISNIEPHASVTLSVRASTNTGGARGYIFY
jgi:hypothetical protein